MAKNEEQEKGNDGLPVEIKRLVRKIAAGFFIALPFILLFVIGCIFHVKATLFAFSATVVVILVVSACCYAADVVSRTS